MLLERHNPKPLYLQLTEVLRGKIDGKEWAPNNAIPSENELSREYGVSRMTARAVVSQLVREGLLYRVPGKGTFVAIPKTACSDPQHGSIREQLEQGGRTALRWIGTTTAPAPDFVHKLLDLKAGTEVHVIRWVREKKATPISLHVTYLPALFFPGLEEKSTTERELNDILETDYGFHCHRRIETLALTTADATAPLLGIETGFPLLILTQVSFDKDKTPFECTEIYFRGDQITLAFSYPA